MKAFSIHRYPSSLDIIKTTTSNDRSHYSSNCIPRYLPTHTALAATWDRALDCNDCSETLLLLYQDTAGQLALGNLTVDGWLWFTLFANPVPGTGLALDVRSMGNVTRNIAIFYQRGNDYLTATLFNGTCE